jgi:hypothetical protein
MLIMAMLIMANTTIMTLTMVGCTLGYRCCLALSHGPFERQWTSRQLKRLHFHLTFTFAFTMGGWSGEVGPLPALTVLLEGDMCITIYYSPIWGGPYRYMNYYRGLVGLGIQAQVGYMQQGQLL